MGRRKAEKPPRRVLVSVDGYEEPEFVIEHALGAVKASLSSFVLETVGASPATAAQWDRVRVERGRSKTPPSPEDARALLKDIKEGSLRQPFLAAFAERLAGDAARPSDLVSRVDDRFIDLCNQAVHGERVAVSDAVAVVETLAMLANAIGDPIAAQHLSGPLQTLRDRVAWKVRRSPPVRKPVKASVACVGIHWVQPRRVVPGSWWVVTLRDGTDAAVDADRTSDQVVEYLMGLKGPAVAGLAFCFSGPAAFIHQHHGGRVEDFWAWCAEKAGDDDRTVVPEDLPSPFRHVQHEEALRRPHDSDLKHFRQTEIAVAKSLQVEPASLFDIGGEGSVGALALKGMPMLAELQSVGAAIWPMDAPQLADGLTCVEIFPRSVWTSLYPGESPRSKKNTMRRWNFIADRREDGVSIPARYAKEIAADERAFDALLTAWALRQYAGTLGSVADETAAVEGRIWLPG